MEDKYTLALGLRKQTVLEQIQECQKIIYRNYLENLSFIANNEKARIKEVEYNNVTLVEKLDILYKELDKLNAEAKTGSDTSK